MYLRTLQRYFAAEYTLRAREFGTYSVLYGELQGAAASVDVASPNALAPIKVMLEGSVMLDMLAQFLSAL